MIAHKQTNLYRQSQAFHNSIGDYPTFSHHLQRQRTMVLSQSRDHGAGRKRGFCLLSVFYARLFYGIAVLDRGLFCSRLL